jgi:hypothetical protein
MKSIKWKKTVDGRNQGSTTGNKVNLCRYCLLSFPDCPAINIVFGDGSSNDNVCMCASYKHSKDLRW